MSELLPFCKIKLQYLLEMVTDHELDDNALRVALYLALAHADHETGESRPSFETIGAAIGKHAKSVKRALNKVEAAGYMTIERGTNKGNSSRYWPTEAALKRATDRRREGDKVVPLRRAKGGQYVFYQYFGGTAPAHHLYGLRGALLMIEEEGLDGIWARHAAIAEAVWAAFDHWGKEGPLQVNAPDPSIRSHSVTALLTGSAKATALREWCESRAGLTLGIGLGMAERTTPEWHHFFRLGHMGHVNAQMILGALGTVEAGLKAVGLPHRPGGALKASELIAARA